MKHILGLLLQGLAMATDPVLIIACCCIAKYGGPGGVAFAVLCVAAITWTNREVGGWFFAWRLDNIKAFYHNWNSNT